MAMSHQTPVSSREGLPEIPGYEILGELGRGGMGVVYKAWHVRLDRIVALKMMLAAREAHFLELARFRVEAEAIARLAHPNIIRIHEVGIHEGSPHVALEYAPGGNLSQRTRKEPQLPPWAAEIVRVLAQALRHAHKRGILHRDLKPANILLMEDGTPKITDFGLAKFSQTRGEVEEFAATVCMDPLTAEVHRLAWEFAQDSGQDPTSEATVEHRAVQNLCRQQLSQFGPEATTRAVQVVEEFLEARRSQLAQPSRVTSFDSSRSFLDGLTEDGAVMGTPQYMAPEQAAGRLRKIGPHTDVYALGAVLYELLTGEPPFTGGTKRQILERVLCEPPPPLPSAVPRELGAVCLKCLEKQPEDRYRSAAELGDELQRFVDGRRVDIASGDPEPPGPEAIRLDERPDCSTVDYDQPLVPGAAGKRTRRWWRLWQ